VLLLAAAILVLVLTMSEQAPAANPRASTTTDDGDNNNRRALIFLHGLGDTPSGWSSLEKSFGSRLPSSYDMTWIFPAAPSAPVSISGGAMQNSWFDIFDWPIGVAARDDKKGLLEV
jgi:predicted esterase